MKNNLPTQQAINNISYGLYVLSVKDNKGFDNACIINTFMQVNSAAEPTFVFSVAKQNLTCDILQKTKTCNVSIITTAADFDFFKKFGFVSGREKNKFAECKNIYRAKNGIAYIKKECNAYFSLKITSTINLDTHIMFLATVQECEELSNIESITYSYYHKNTKPKFKTEEKKTMGYRCTICDYVLEEETLPADFICPLCAHGASDFVKV